MDFNQYLGKTVRVELDEGKAISGVCSKVTEAAKSPVHENTISITITVSYTHLDVYKRQGVDTPQASLMVVITNAILDKPGKIILGDVYKGQDL